MNTIYFEKLVFIVRDNYSNILKIIKVYNKDRFWFKWTTLKRFLSVDIEHEKDRWKIRLYS